MLKTLLTFLALILSRQMVSASSDTLEVQRLLTESSSYQRSNVDSCFLLANQALDLATKLHYKSGLSGAYIQLSAVMMIRGDNESSLAYADKSIEFGSAAHDYPRIAMAWLLKGYTYETMGSKDLSLAAFYEALKYSRLTGDSGCTKKVYVALGDFYGGYEDYQKALSYYNQAYRISLQMGNLYDAGDALLGVGNIYYHQGAFETALRYYMQVDSLGRLIGEVTGIAQNLNNIALCYVELKDKNRALYFYREALHTYMEQGMLFEQSNLYYNLACLYHEFGDNDSTIYYCQKSITLCNEATGEVEKVAQCYELMAKAYAGKGDFYKAYKHHQQYAALSDSVLNSEKVARISEMQTKYETEKKELEIRNLNEQNEAGNKLRNALVIGLIILLGFLFEVVRQRNKVNKERKKSDKLLLNILPEEVAEELKLTGSAQARQYPHVTVLFTDFVNFTGISQQMTPTELVQEIHHNFTAFDAIMEKHGLEKIKTIGDAYLAVCGLPNEVENHAQRVVAAAIDLLKYLRQENALFEIRIGVHSGPVIAGIVGVKKYAYDIWGDTVNTAARMEQNSEAGKINISGSTYELVKDDFNCIHRGRIQAKNKGEIDMYFVL